MIIDEITKLLADSEFVYVATSDFGGQPNVAPKFFLKVEDNFIYLVDYVIGRTYQNLKINPRASLSIVDSDNLKGYQINGQAAIIESGSLYTRITKETTKRLISLSVKRIVEGVHAQRTHKNFEVTFPEQVVILKIKIEEIVEIGPSGKLTRKRIQS